jgi:uncharacterized membrane protein YsdA (DUF1294 family)
MLLLFAATSFACLNPSHHDGDNIRCSNIDGAMRLHGIDAPEMPGACRPGRDCTPGDPYAARDYLRSLTRGRDVRCTVVDVDVYGRQVVECAADGQNLGCAMIAGGHAVERYGSPDCGGGTRVAAAPPDYPAGEPPRPGRVDPAIAEPQATPPPIPAPTLPPPAIETTWWEDLRADLAYAWAWTTERAPVGLFLVCWLAALSVLGFALMAIDKRRAIIALHRRVRRIPESILLLVAAAGGSPGVLLARQVLRHKTLKQPFSRNLIAILGLQIGLTTGLLWLALTG